MGLQLPSALTEPLSWIGLTWPEADEDLLYEAGREWIAFAGRLRAIAADADRAASQVWNSAEGPAVDAFHRWWGDGDGPKNRLLDDATAAEIIAAALFAFAAATLAMKVAFIAQLVTLAIEVAQAIATAVVSFGATTAEIPVFVAATRYACRRLIREVLQHIQTVIADLLKRARTLLRRYSHKGVHTPHALTRRLEEFEAKLADDLRRVNPNFDPAHPAYGANCTHCVQAFEMRRRGYDLQATALPRDYWRFHGRPLSHIENVWGRSFTDSTHEGITHAFEKAGHGARGIVYIRWDQRFGDGAHVFSVENINGKVVFVDAQSGSRDVSHYFTRGWDLKYLRTDDLPPAQTGEFTQ